MSAEAILNLLRGLCESTHEIEACMVGRRGLEGVMMFPESFKEDVGPVWEPLSRVLNDVLSVIERDSIFKMKTAYVGVLDFGIAFYVLGGSDNALIVFLKDDGNTVGKLSRLEGEIKKTLAGILKILA